MKRFLFIILVLTLHVTPYTLHVGYAQVKKELCVNGGFEKGTDNWLLVAGPYGWKDTPWKEAKGSTPDTAES